MYVTLHFRDQEKDIFENIIVLTLHIGLVGFILTSDVLISNIHMYM